VDLSIGFIAISASSSQAANYDEEKSKKSFEQKIKEPLSPEIF